jgi:ABC-2 type transport system permease protein
MTGDVRSILWKEFRSITRTAGSKTRILLTVSIPIVYFGVVTPILSGPDYVDLLDPWFIAVILPLLTVVMTAPDSFAGERERRTLRTLLVSRLPDTAILYGKILFAVITGLAMMLVTLLIALITVNVTSWGEGVGLIFFAPGRLAAMVGVATLLSLMVSSAAVLISLRAATVQQAQQTLVAAVFLVPTVLGPIVFLLLGSGGSDVVTTVFDALGSPLGRSLTIACLVVLTASLLWLARTRFQRDRLSILH